MRKEDFKLLIENFNNFIIKESIGHSQKSIDLLNSVPDEFKNCVNASGDWHCAEDWVAGIEFNDDKEKQEKVNFYKDIARKLGCAYEDLLITYTDYIYDFVNPADRDEFFNAYDPKKNSFFLKGKELKGYKDIVVTVVAPVCTVKARKLHFDSGPARN